MTYKIEKIHQLNSIRILLSQDISTIPQLEKDLNDNNIHFISNMINIRVNDRSNVLNPFNLFPKILHILSKYTECGKKIS